MKHPHWSAIALFVDSFRRVAHRDPVAEWPTWYTFYLSSISWDMCWSQCVVSRPSREFDTIPIDVFYCQQSLGNAMKCAKGYDSLCDSFRWPGDAAEKFNESCHDRWSAVVGSVMFATSSIREHVVNMTMSAGKWLLSRITSWSVFILIFQKNNMHGPFSGRPRRLLPLEG